MDEVRELKRWTRTGAAVTAEALLAAVGVSQPSVLLLLGHMRSGSTLLLHLLLTHPAVAALGERNAVYASRGDLARLALATRASARAPLRRLRYVADQVNHNRFTPNSWLLGDPRVRVLFMLRKPEASLVSLLELSRIHYEGSWSALGAVNYYVERLGFLTKLAASLPSAKCAALVTYETLTDSPQQTLEALRIYLELQHGFSQTYSTQPFTGSRGDPGPNIRVGRILRRQSTPSVDLERCDLQRATEAYVGCREALARFALCGMPARE